MVQEKDHARPDPIRRVFQAIGDQRGLANRVISMPRMGIVRIVFQVAAVAAACMAGYFAYLGDETSRMNCLWAMTLFLSLHLSWIFLAIFQIGRNRLSGSLSECRFGIEPARSAETRQQIWQGVLLRTHPTPSLSGFGSDKAFLTGGRTAGLCAERLELRGRLWPVLASRICRVFMSPVMRRHRMQSLHSQRQARARHWSAVESNMCWFWLLSR